MRVLVTGGAGFIGSKLSIKLLNMGYEVRVLDNLSKQIHGENSDTSYTYSLIRDRVDFIKGDVRNMADWEKSLKGVDFVVHLAAETGTGQSMYEVSKYVDVNINGTAHLLDYVANSKGIVKKIVVASSRAVYGEGKYECAEHGAVYPLARVDADMLRGDFEVKCPICAKNVELLATDEESKSHPTSVYGYTKKVQEELSMLVGASVGVPVVGLRFQNVYGPGQSLKNPYTGILSIFSTRIANGNDINIFEDGLESRDFVYIDDVVDSIILALTKEKADFQVFNIGSDTRTDVLTIAKTLCNAYESNINLSVTGDYRLGDIRHNIADISKAKRLLGYQPKVSFDEGISNFVNWVKKQEVQPDLYDASIQEMKAKGLMK